MTPVTQESNATSTYREEKIGKTLYRVTSIYMGEKDLGKTLEQLAVRTICNELTTGVKGNINA